MPFVGAAGLVALEHVTVGVAPSPAAPKKIYSVAKNRFLRSVCRAHDVAANAPRPHEAQLGGTVAQLHSPG